MTSNIRRLAKSVKANSSNLKDSGFESRAADQSIERRLRKMLRVAEKLKGFAGSRIYAEIWDGKKRISFGKNGDHESDLSRLYARKDEAIGTHAEVDSIINALTRRTSVLGSTMFVVRAKKITRGGEFTRGLARPCEGCLRMLENFGVDRVIYTLDDAGYMITNIGWRDDEYSLI